MELPDGTKIPSIGVSPNHSFKAIPIIRSVATMEKIAEDEEDDFDENCERNFEDVKEKKLSLAEDSELLQARRVRREARMSERRLSRNLTATVFSSAVDLRQHMHQGYIQQSATGYKKDVAGPVVHSCSLTCIT